MSRSHARLLGIAILWTALAISSAIGQVCAFTSIPTTGPACKTPELAGKVCPLVPFDTFTSWSGPNPLAALQSYRNGSLLAEIPLASSGKVTLGQMVKDTEGELELKGWAGDSSPCGRATLNAVKPTAAPPPSCSTAKLTIPDTVRFDTPVSWDRPSCRVTVQGYEGASLVGQVLREARSGDVTIRDISSGNSDKLLIKIWPEGATKPSDERIVTIEDCRKPKLTISTVPGPQTQLSWVLGKCMIERIEAFKEGVSIGRLDKVKSDEKRLGALVGDKTGLIELRVAAENASTITESRWIEVNSGSPEFFGSFVDDFTRNKGWLNFMTEEIPNPACYDTGSAAIALAPEITHNGNPTLRLKPNEKGRAASIHLIAGNRLTDAAQSGRWIYSAYFYLPADAAGGCEAGPEISLQRTIPTPGGTRTYIAGLQFQCNPQNAPAKVNAWAIWQAGDSKGPWVQVATQAVPRDRWLKLELEADLEEYVRFSLTGDGVNLNVPLAGKRIFPEDRKFEPSTWLTLEAENQNTCSNPSVTRTTVYYADAAIVRPDVKLFSAANSQQLNAAPESLVTAKGEGLAARIDSAPGPPWPTQLGNTQVKVTDDADREIDAGLLYVSPSQINFQVPAKASRTARVRVLTSERQASAGRMPTKMVAPAFFTAGDTGIAAGFAQCCVDGRCTATSLDAVHVGSCSETYLEIYGTGFAGRSSMNAVTAKVGSVSVPVPFAGAQGIPGLDQANLGPLPKSLAGQGKVDLVLVVDSEAAPTVQIRIID